MRGPTPLAPVTASAQALREVVGTEQNGVTCQGPSHGTWKANMAEILFCSLPFSGSTQNKDRETRDKGVVAMPDRQRAPHLSDCTRGAGVGDTAQTDNAGARLKPAS